MDQKPPKPLNLPFPLPKDESLALLHRSFGLDSTSYDGTIFISLDLKGMWDGNYDVGLAVLRTGDVRIPRMPWNPYENQIQCPILFYNYQLKPSVEKVSLFGDTLPMLHESWIFGLVLMGIHLVEFRSPSYFTYDAKVVLVGHNIREKLAEMELVAPGVLAHCKIESVIDLDILCSAPEYTFSRTVKDLGIWKLHGSMDMRCAGNVAA